MKTKNYEKHVILGLKIQPGMLPIEKAILQFILWSSSSDTKTLPRLCLMYPNCQKSACINTH